MAQTKTETKSNIGIRPLAGYLLVEPLAAESKTAGGLYLPETAQEKPVEGMVVAVGPDIYLDNGRVIMSPVQVGQKVVYKKWGADELKVNGKEYKIVKFEDLMAVIEE